MYFAYGWPTVFSTSLDAPSAPATAAASDGSDPPLSEQEVVYLTADAELLVLVTSRGIQLWSAGQHRIRLGTLARDPDALAAEGLNKRAFWSPSRRLLAIVVSRWSPICHSSTCRFHSPCV